MWGQTHAMWSKSGHVVSDRGVVSLLHPASLQKPNVAVQETEPLDIIIVRRGHRSTGEAFVLLRMPIQVELVLRKNKTYIGKRYVEVTLAKKLVRSCLT